MLAVEHMSKAYGTVQALSDFTYSFDRGIYALLGPNGSGKSTLMNILTCNLACDKGRILFHGRAVDANTASYYSKIGYMPQYPGMYPAFTAFEMLDYLCVLKGMNRQKAASKIHELLDIVELSDVQNRPIRTFSGGMKQRLALAQAFLGEPEIVVLDEPTAGLDPKQRIIVRNFLSQISGQITVLVSTHVVSDIEYIAKEAVLLKKGHIIDAGSPAVLAEKLQGQVWAVTADEADLEMLKAHYPITEIVKTAQGVNARVIAREAPLPHAVCVKPGLEEYYLSVFGDVLC